MVLVGESGVTQCGCSVEAPQHFNSLWKTIKPLRNRSERKHMHVVCKTTPTNKCGKATEGKHNWVTLVLALNSTICSVFFWIYIKPAWTAVSNESTNKRTCPAEAALSIRVSSHLAIRNCVDPENNNSQQLREAGKSIHQLIWVFPVAEAAEKQDVTTCQRFSVLLKQWPKRK